MGIKTPNAKTIYNSGFVNATLTISPSLGPDLDTFLGLHGPVQIFIDQEFMNQIKPYMPFKNGVLQELMISASTPLVGSGENVTPGPYARYLYYGMLMVDSVTGSAWSPPGGTKVVTDIPLEYHGGGQSGPKWDERWSAANLPAFVQSVQKYIDKGGA